jgi:hypothetical protein
MASGFFGLFCFGFLAVLAIVIVLGPVVRTRLGLKPAPLPMRPPPPTEEEMRAALDRKWREELAREERIANSWWMWLIGGLITVVIPCAALILFARHLSPLALEVGVAVFVAVTLANAFSNKRTE